MPFKTNQEFVLGHGGQRLDSLLPFCHSGAGLWLQFVLTHLVSVGQLLSQCAHSLVRGIPQHPTDAEETGENLNLPE